jgi:hypothetical protein
MADLLTVKYSCAPCRIKRREVKVRYREKGENVVYYVEKVVAAAVTEDHKQQSPWCKVKTITEVMIPMDASGQIVGGRTEH